MHKFLRIAVPVLVASLISVPLAVAQSPSAAPDERNSVVVVFKDGHRKTFSMSEVARIEFPGNPTMASSAGQGRFLGEWKVGDCAGAYFTITLERDGIARKTIGAPHGTWIVVDGEARITWEDGNRDTIRKAGDTYEKAWYAPDRSYAEQASCTASAESLDRKPI